MESHRITGKAGEDGIVHLDLPLGTPHREYEMIVVVQPHSGGDNRPTEVPAEWAAFVAATAGSIQDETFFGHDQGGPVEPSAS